MFRSSLLRLRPLLTLAVIFSLGLILTPGAGAATAKTTCKASLMRAETAQLAALSDTSKIKDLATAKRNVTQIADIPVPKKKGLPRAPRDLLPRHPH